MSFMFGYSREVQVKIERNPSKLALIGLAILIVVLFIFLTFEDLDEQSSVSNIVLNAPSSSVSAIDSDISSGTDSEIISEQVFRRSELKN
jgi:hypothetical protein